MPHCGVRRGDAIAPRAEFSAPVYHVLIRDQYIRADEETRTRTDDLRGRPLRLRNLGSAADSTFWITRIPRPVLLVRDSADGVVLPFEPYMLLSAARAEGSLVLAVVGFLCITLATSGEIVR